MLIDFSTKRYIVAMNKFIFFVWIFFPVLLHAQKPIVNIPSAIADFDADLFGTLYIVSGSALHTYAKDGTKKYVFEKKEYGRLSDIDCRNVHKVVLFYSEPGVFIFLDKNGAEIGTELSIRDIGLYNVTTFCHASDGTLWLSDNDSQVFVQISRAGAVLFKSTNWGKYTSSADAKKMYLSEDYLLLATDNAIDLFTQQGAYIKTIHLPERATFVNAWKNTAFYFQNQSLVSINLQTSAEVSRKIQAEKKVIFCTNGQIFTSDLNTVFVESVQMR